MNNILGGVSAKTERVRIFSPDGVYYESQSEFTARLLKQLGQVLVFSGARGSGKTLSMTCFVCFALVQGFKVWSNYKVSFDQQWPGGQVEHFETLPLDMKALYTFDSELSEGYISIDEINLWCSARRSMSVANRLLNSALQLIRKRRLSFMFTCQNFNWLDAMLRFQTDCHILCDDQSHHHGTKPGEWINWRVRDMSGLYTGKPYYESEQENLMWFHGSPFWNCYDSWQEFDTVDAARGVTQIQDRIKLDYRESHKFGNEDATIAEVLDTLRLNGEKEYSSQEIQEYFESNSLKVDPRHIGRHMKKAGFSYHQTRKGNFYTRAFENKVAENP